MVLVKGLHYFFYVFLYYFQEKYIRMVRDFQEVVQLKEQLASDNRYLNSALISWSGDEVIGAETGLKPVMQKVEQIAILPDFAKPYRLPALRRPSTGPYPPDHPCPAPTPHLRGIPPSTCRAPRKETESHEEHRRGSPRKAAEGSAGLPVGGHRPRQRQDPRG